MMETKIIKIGMLDDCSIILGQAHFIKTVEDLYEALVNSVPNIKFGLAFCEASGECLVRFEGNDEELKTHVKKNTLALGCGHSFLIYMKYAYPLNVMNRIKEVAEVCTIYAATANPLEVIVAETEQGRGILGVIDGLKSRGIETDDDIQKRKELLRKIGYKR